jgi:hypothetical protein
MNNKSAKDKAVELIPKVAGGVCRVTIGQLEQWGFVTAPYVGVVVGVMVEATVAELLSLGRAGKAPGTQWPEGGKTLYFQGGGFTHKSDESYKVVDLPLCNTSAGTPEAWSRTLGTLKQISIALCGDPEALAYVISLNGLPINAAIAIGYAFHKNNHIALYYQVREQKIGSAAKAKPLRFKQTLESAAVPEGGDAPVDMCVYVHAKSNVDGEACFDEYLSAEAAALPYPQRYKYINRESYDEQTDLGATANQLVGYISKAYAGLQKQHGVSRVRLHLFFNGFAGLALMLGAQLPQTTPVYLYDYEAETKTYHPAICLLAKHFRDTQTAETAEKDAAKSR